MVDVDVLWILLEVFTGVCGLMGLGLFVRWMIIRRPPAPKIVPQREVYREPYICRPCRLTQYFSWLHDCAHTKRDSLFVSEGQWEGIEKWLKRWRGKPWHSRD